MATDDHGDDTETYTPRELRDLSDDEAADLSDAQRERREKLLALEADAEQTADRFAQEAEEVHGIAIKNTPEELGTVVETMDNELVVHLDPENRHVRQHLKKIDEYAQEGRDVPDVTELSLEEELAAVDHVMDVLRQCIIKFNGDNLRQLPDDERADVFDVIRQRWGASGVMLAFSDIVIATNRERQERAEVMESFR
jgi:hypothetical protein